MHLLAVAAVSGLALAQPAAAQPRPYPWPQPAPVFPLTASPAGTFQASPPPAAQCRAAIAMAERMSGVPDRLMQAIGVVESGRRDGSGTVAAYPWTINAEGVGSYYATKPEAIAAVLALRARGVRSVDVGCMQVNLMHHADAFASLEEAFDPAANAAYAARFLLRLLAQTGSWPGAVAGYHSLTPDIGAEYGRKVMAVWARPAAPASLPPPLPVQPAAPVAASFSAQAAGAGRIIPLPATGVSATGRSLESYRLAPTRLAVGATAGRG